MDRQPVDISTQYRNSAESRVILKGVSWQTFETLMREMGESRDSRIAYQQEMLELMVPYEEHEEPRGLLEKFIEVLGDESQLEVSALGSPLLKHRELNLAIEPDACFYLGRRVSIKNRANKAIDLATVSPPDLAIEINYTRRALGKFEIYSALRVPEFWRYEKQSLQVYQLVGSEYDLCNQSLAFPFLPIAEILELIEQSKTLGQKETLRLFRMRVRTFL
ncbi:Uma2 family endonuclease [Leptolyngbya sp. FACHB-261]|uniref:Uma2 family endonuclease n=1 Tax=Leptolyngbya sp. FACHB-261 TaxID=2692806 RepID=UPI00168521B2|nr:Uma2 family endonuclease [Leptolyngbya sp. FACHB-261]MBD2101233.1 Uma2 family endonuclease [Leptolyngbya sp. FACHB-261]